MPESGTEVKPCRILPNMNYYAKYVAEGRCAQCAVVRTDDDGGTAIHCAPCAEEHRTVHRNRYRLRKGIPLDAPVDKRGRPRVSRGSPAAP